MKHLGEDELKEFRGEIRLACQCLAMCWDHLHSAEVLAETEIEVEDISEMASDLPIDPISTDDITDEEIDTLLSDEDEAA